MSRGYNGRGVPNRNDMMKQVKQLQKQMQEAQEKLEETEVEASSGGGMVKVKANGNKEILSITLDPEIVDPEDVEMLQDMILVAVNDAMKQVDELTDSALGNATGGLTAGFNFPGF